MEPGARRSLPAWLDPGCFSPDLFRKLETSSASAANIYASVVDTLQVVASVIDDYRAASRSLPEGTHEEIGEFTGWNRICTNFSRAAEILAALGDGDAARALAIREQHVVAARTGADGL